MYLAEAPRNDKVNNPLQKFGSSVWGVLHVTTLVLQVWGGF